MSSPPEQRTTIFHNNLELIYSAPEVIQREPGANGCDVEFEGWASLVWVYFSHCSSE